MSFIAIFLIALTGMCAVSLFSYNQGLRDSKKLCDEMLDEIADLHIEMQKKIKHIRELEDSLNGSIRNLCSIEVTVKDASGETMGSYNFPS